MRSNRYDAVKKILWIILFANFGVSAIKIIIGITTKSQSVIADGIHSLADGLSNVVGLIGIWLASRPRDDRHPYGHDKYEIMASLFIGIMLAIMAIRITSRAVVSLENPTVLDIDLIEVILMVFTIIINLVVASTEHRLGKKLESTILITDSMHTKADVLISAGVMFGLIAMKVGVPPLIDSIISILVSIAVIISAWQIIKSSVDILVDSRFIDSKEIRELLIDMPEIHDIHKIRSRGELSHAFIDLHVVVDSHESVEFIHKLSHKLETMLRQHFGASTEVSIHFEPDEK